MVSGSDAILLGAETLRGLYPVETITVVRKICAEVRLIMEDQMLLDTRRDCSGPFLVYVLFFAGREGL